MANEQAARAIIKKLLNRSGFDAWYEDLDDDLQAEILAEMAGCIPEPTKPEVVDGEVTMEHREAAANAMFPSRLPGSLLDAWVRDGGNYGTHGLEQDEPPGPSDRVAQAIATAESRGFAAGRASVTAKAEGWVRCEERMPEEFEPVLVVEAENAKPEPYVAFRENDEWHVYSSSFAIRGPTHWMPLPPAPADTELKGET